MKARVFLVVLGVVCLAFGVLLAIACYARYQMEFGAVLVGLVFAAAASAIISAGLPSGKLCDKCGEPIRPARRAGRASPPSGEGC